MTHPLLISLSTLSSSWRISRGIIGALTAVVLIATTAAPALADETVRVTRDGQAGWLFNRDASTSTPYEFTTDEASTGYGSIYVPPITNQTGEGDPEPKDKFIAEQFVHIPAAELESISYDFLIAGDGIAADANEFYLNIYTVLPDSNPETTFYDCRFDYVPGIGSTDVFTTETFTDDDVADGFGDKNKPECPTELNGLPDGTTISFFSISVGDTSANDTGLAGYYDNVVVNTTDGTTTYDFEAAPQTKEDCRDDGYADYGFKNQGQCISSIVSQRPNES